MVVTTNIYPQKSVWCVVRSKHNIEQVTCSLLPLLLSPHEKPPSLTLPYLSQSCRLLPELPRAIQLEAGMHLAYA